VSKCWCEGTVAGKGEGRLRRKESVRNADTKFRGGRVRRGSECRLGGERGKGMVKEVRTNLGARGVEREIGQWGGRVGKTGK